MDLDNISDTDGDSMNIIDTNTLFDGEAINLDQTPVSNDWYFPPLFSEGLTGETRVWQIGFVSSQKELKTIHGILITSKNQAGEKLQTAFHPIVENKSGRSLQEQALLEARRRYINKYKDGYLPPGTESPDINKPMLAKTWHHHANPNKPKSNHVRIKKFPVSVQRKIDGIRALSKLRGNKIEMRSRLSNVFPYFDHIKAELETFLRYLPAGSELDGELYCLDMPFELLSGVVKTVKRKHEKHDELQYWIFDIIDPDRSSWEKRYTMLVNAYIKYLEDGNTSNTFRILQAYHAENNQHLDQYHDAFVAEGYEGIIIRKYSYVDGEKLSQYSHARTNALIKYKYFEDEEMEIVDVEQCTGTEDGAAKFVVKDPRGNVFPVRPRGSVEQRCEWYMNKQNLIGKPLTVRYQGLSEKGVPRFPVAITVRDYE